MDVGAWLQSLGMERYEKVFRENAVDEDVLPNLSADDLKELGITSVGHRRKLLDGLAELRAQSRPGQAHGRTPVPPARDHGRDPPGHCPLLLEGTRRLRVRLLRRSPHCDRSSNVASERPRAASHAFASRVVSRRFTGW